MFYAFSDLIGEENLNTALSKFIEKNKFKGPPYPTSIELVENIKKVTPDSLHYAIKDMFETITLYENEVVDFTTKALNNGTYKVDITVNVSKYRSGKNGIRFYSDNQLDSIFYKTETMKSPKLSLPLSDYIDIGIFGEEEIDGKKKEIVLYLQKHKITSIHNKMTIIVNQKPTEIGIDPYNKLIDTDSKDNRMKL